MSSLPQLHLALHRGVEPNAPGAEGAAAAACGPGGSGGSGGAAGKPSNGSAGLVAGGCLQASLVLKRRCAAVMLESLLPQVAAASAFSLLHPPPPARCRTTTLSPLHLLRSASGQVPGPGYPISRHLLYNSEGGFCPTLRPPGSRTRSWRCEKSSSSARGRRSCRTPPRPACDPGGRSTSRGRTPR